jgi:5-methyltetrahydrofolate--homocysteine methyltransferase
MEELVNAGATILGGCCGTAPEHIACITNKFGREITSHVDRSPKGMHYLTSERKTLAFGLEDPLLIVGERINPTGKKALQQELKENTYDLLLEYAEDQEDAGAALLDVNVGMNGIDEKEVMLQALEELSLTTSLPLSLDSSHIEVMEAALRHYHGRALINSISLEKDKISQWLPIAKKYGAMFILLPLSDQGLPKSCEEKIAMIETILQEAKKLGFEKEDIVVDGLVTTIATNKQAAVDTLRAIRYCKENDLATIVGLSNISYGMPARSQLNSAFLNLAIKDGLTMAIANPCQDLYVSCDLATEVLLGKENADLLFIEKNAGLVKHNEANKSSDEKQALYQAVMKGNKNAATTQTLQLLSAGADPVEILNKTLMPAMDEVGKLFATGKYFLPQLIHSAEAMETAIKQIEPLLAVSDDTESRQTIILASVEGDIHDIGKNLVGLMLKNHGYHIVDLGKDVPAETIVNAAIEQDAQIIGLSALMTTTMQRMREVVNLVKEKQLKTKVIVGGAVITKEYADEIHADGYSKDAQEAVLLVKELLA